MRFASASGCLLSIALDARHPKEKKRTIDASGAAAAKQAATR
jgi:hypothetical protein